VPCRPDVHTSAASNFHIKASHVWTKGMVVRTVDLMHAISISDARAFGPRGLMPGRLDFQCDTYLMNEHVRTGFHNVSILALFGVWTKSLICKDAANRDSTVHSEVRRNSSSLSAVRTICHPVRMPTIPAPSVRTTCHTVRTQTVQHHPSGHLHSIKKLLCQLASVRTFQ
jgi:hypothetical protein